MKKALFLAFLSVSVAWGADLPIETKIEVYEDWSGGLNTASEKGKIPNNQASYIRNLYIDEVWGQLTKRNGYVQMGSTSSISKVSFMFSYKKEDGTKYFIVSDSSQVYATQDFNTYIFIASNLVTTSNLQATQVRNKVWFTNGQDNIFTWDGATKQSISYVPKGEYIAYYHERVWIYDDATALLSFSALTSTDATIVAPDDTRAWKATNALYIGRGDGQNGTGLFVYNGLLYAMKEGSIYPIYGTSPSDYFARMVDAHVGTTSQDTIVALDGYIYFLGKNGIYRFDGKNSQRISDAIQPDINNILNSVVREILFEWETKTDFDKGQHFGTYSSAGGGVKSQRKQLDSDSSNLWNAFNSSGAPTDRNTGNYYQIIATGTSFLPWAIVKPTTFTATVDNLYFPSTVKIWAKPISQNTNYPTIYFRENAKNLQIFDAADFGVGGCFSPPSWCQFPASLVESNFRHLGLDYTNEKITVSITTSNGNVSGDGFEIYIVTNTGYSEMRFPTPTHVQYISQISTVTTIDNWGKFDAEGITPGSGDEIQYFIQSATSVVSISTWTAISPGANLSFSNMDKFIRWAATITYNGVVEDTTTVTYAYISYNIGSGNADRAFATSWKNRFLLSIATTSNNMSYQYVKSKITNPNPDAWMMWDNINIRSFCKDGEDFLYAGSASTGSVYRLDYGTNDGVTASSSTAIVGRYDTGETDFGNRFLRSNLVELDTDADKGLGKTLKLGVSVDGSGYEYTSIDYNGTGALLNPNYGYRGKYGKSFSFSFVNDQKDMDLKFNALGVFYAPTRIR